MSAVTDPVSCPSLQMYNFTSFTVSLNELQTGMEKILAPTDCRLRPDIRGMEDGNMGAPERGTCVGAEQEGGCPRLQLHQRAGLSPPSTEPPSSLCRAG